MKRALRVFLILLLLLPLTALFPAKVLSVDCSDPTVAAKSFASTYDLTISVSESGSAIVTQKVSLKNLTGICYVSDYGMDIRSPKVRDISGKDSEGALNINVSRDKSTTRISARLNEQVTKKDKCAEFTLSYTVDDLAKKEGNIWSLVAYRIKASEKIESYVTKILVPTSFGEIFSATPAPDSVTQSAGGRILTFGNSSLSSEGIFAKFGDEQQIGFSLQIPLENRSFFKRSFSIILPPDTERQQVLLTKIQPAPEKIVLDKSGNYLADYQVGAGTSVVVDVEGFVRLIGKNSFPAAKVLSQSELADLKAGGSFVPVQDKLIQEKAKELKEPLKIYNFVTSYLTFDHQALAAAKAGRSGAAALLRNKKEATNLDFVDLFVSLAKAARIEAREVFGITPSADQENNPTFVAAPLNTSSLHVWAQIYDPGQKNWVDVDPTWGNTSGATYFGQAFSDRVALFFSSAGDDLGGLEKLTAPGGDIKSTYLVKKPDFSPKVDLKLQADQAFAGFPMTLSATIENKSGVSLIDNKIDLAASGLTLIGEKERKLPIIFPFEKRTVKFKIRSGNLFNGTQGRITASLEGKSGSQTLKMSKEIGVRIQPFFSLGSQQILLLFLIVLLLAGIFASRVRPAKKN